MRPVDYGTVQRQTAGGRSSEREILERVNARMKAARPDDVAGLALLHEALRLNRNIWLTFAVDLSSPSNRLPDELKAQLISLAGFIERNTAAASRDPEMLKAIIAINESVAQGLSAAAPQENAA